MNSFFKVPLKIKPVVCRRCHEEFDKKDAALQADPETQKQFHSYVLFLGHLYLNLEVRCAF